MHVVLHHVRVVPPEHYGGTERVMYWLGKGLVELGHEVTLIAPEGSGIPGARFVPLAPDKPINAQVPPDADVVHLRNTPAEKIEKPYVVSIDGNGTPGSVFDANTLFVSRRHAQVHGSTQFVHNGIDVNEYACEDEREDYAVFLAQAAWSVKNVRGAIQVARAAGMRLHVLGEASRRQRIERFLPTMRHVTWHGAVTETEKRRILSRSRALIFPVRWEEPFGIAITEALASGCAVFGTPYGALPEIVTPEVGTLSANGADLAAALRDARDRFDPKACRARVAQGGFTGIDMARAFVRHYQSVVATGRVADADLQPPRTPADFEYWRLLPWAPP